MTTRAPWGIERTASRTTLPILAAIALIAAGTLPIVVLANHSLKCKDLASERSFLPIVCEDDIRIHRWYNDVTLDEPIADPLVIPFAVRMEGATVVAHLKHLSQRTYNVSLHGPEGARENVNLDTPDGDDLVVRLYAFGDWTIEIRPYHMEIDSERGFELSVQAIPP